MATMFIITAVVSLGLFFLVTLIQGVREMSTTRALKKHAKRVQGQVLVVDIKSAGQAGTYGKVRFSYQVHDVTYSQKQTVARDTALALFSGSKEVAVLFLPKKPSVARLALAPSNYARMLSFILVLLCLGILVVVLLGGILSSASHPT